jgi:hypothetical protein
MHLNAELALDLVDRRMDERQEAFWKEHVENCGSCAREYGYWQQLGAGLKRAHLESAPAESLNAAMDVCERLTQEGSSSVRRVFAAMIFDSFTQPAMAGARGSSTEPVRQLVMRADEFDVHIRIWGDRDRKQIHGQLLPRQQGAVPHAVFHLLQHGKRLDSTMADELGEFHFSSVPEGDLSIQVDLPNLTVIGGLNIYEAS